MSATRVTTRSLSTQVVNIAECAEKIDRLTKRTRHASKTGGAEKESTPAEIESTPIVEDTPPRQPESSDDNEINPIAVKLWHQLFKTTDYVKIAGNSDFFHKKVRKLLTTEQARKVAEALEKDIINRKVDFLKLKETNAAKLRLSLQELFTKIVIRRIRSELAQSKEDATAKLEHLTNLDKQALKKWSVQEKSIEKSKKVTGAESGIIDLLGIVNEYLKEA